MSVIEFEKHAAISGFIVEKNDLLIGGKTASELSMKADGHAFYAYDSTVMTRQVASLRKHFPESVSLHYAMKANPMPEVVQFMSGLVDGIDVASKAELEMAIKTPTPRHEISFAGPGKGLDELAAAIEYGIVINCESPTELERIHQLAQERDVRPKVALRVNPDFQLQSSGMKMSGGAQQFGIDAEQIPDVLKRMAKMSVEFHGFHIFSGSQNLKPSAIVESQQKACELAVRLAKDAPAPVRLLNIGGGLGIPYFPGESHIDVKPIGDNLAILAEQMKTALPESQLTIELGRYFVAEAGVYICTITDKKESRGQIFLITNGGLHHHLAASGNFGQILRKNYPVAIANRMAAKEKETASVVGPLCTPLDLLASKMSLSAADIGDLVAVFYSGAYGFTASPHWFLSHPHPTEFFL